MKKKIGLGLLVLLVAFLSYVATRDGKFHYERSGVINASPDKIYPFLSNLKMGMMWSPFEQKDPGMKRNFVGPVDQVGSIYEFEGNSDVGAGKLEFLKMTPNESVDLKLTMTKPFYGENIIQYKLTPEASGTRFTWTMSGDGGYLSKLMSVFIDCEKMIGSEFAKGIENLKVLVEAHQHL